MSAKKKETPAPTGGKRGTKTQGSTAAATSVDLDPQKESILIIGDWFIDENWLVAPQSNYSSSHTGEIHYISMHDDIDKRMINLCGASEILEVIRSYFLREEDAASSFNLIGFGAWNPEDNSVIRCALCQEHKDLKFITPYRIKSLDGDPNNPVFDCYEAIRDRCPYKQDANNNCSYSAFTFNITRSPKATTNRIIRCYQGTKGGVPHLKYRFDWVINHAPHIDNKCFGILKGQKVKYLIIEDHGKGVVNNDTIKGLLPYITLQGPDATNIYIRSKLDDPEWLSVLADKGCKARLVVSDYKLVTKRVGERRLFFGKELCTASLELLQHFTHDIAKKANQSQEDQTSKDSDQDEKAQPSSPGYFESQRCAILLDNNTAIAKEDDNCYLFDEPVGNKQLINIGRSTMFFAALVAQDIMAEIGFTKPRKKTDPKRDNDFASQCYKAIRVAFDWSRSASKRWKEGDHFFYGDYAEALPLRLWQAERRDDPKSKVRPSSHSDSLKYWTNSSLTPGTITRKIGGKDVKRFELWRGYGALDDYICVGPLKRGSINDLISSISKHLSAGKPTHHFHSLLIASPGWGKSYLASRLAAHFGLKYVEFSLAELATTDDLVKKLNQINSVQSTSKKTTLVFIDEVNSAIGNELALRLLLGPIWNGRYVADGYNFVINPAVWLFASTCSIEDLAKSNKGEDFISRINGPIVNFDEMLRTSEKSSKSTLINAISSLRKLVATGSSIADCYQDPQYMLFNGTKGEFKTEQVYIAISLLMGFWQDSVVSVQEDVLRLFAEIMPLNGFRSFEFFVSKFPRTDRGRVFPSHVPTYQQHPELMRHVILPNWWTPPKDDPGKLIDIISRS